MSRSERLEEATHAAVNKVFHYWSFDKLSQCFPNVSQTALEQAYEQCKQFIRENTLKKYRELEENHQLMQRLSQLDESHPEIKPFDPLAASNPPPCRPSLAAQAIQLPAYEAEIQRLQSELEKEQALREEQTKALASAAAELQSKQEEAKRCLESLDVSTVVGLSVPSYFVTLRHRRKS